MILHDWELSAEAYAVRLGAALMGVALERRGLDVLPDRETEAAAFRALTPFARLPVLEDGTVAARSVTGALIHLARTRAPHWLPADAAPRIADWLAFAEADLRPARAAREDALMELPGPFADPAAAARPAFRILDSHLAERSFAGACWLEGDAPSIAEPAVFAPVALAVDFGELLEDYPALRAWTRRVRALPGFVAMPGVPAFL